MFLSDNQYRLSIIGVTINVDVSLHKAVAQHCVFKPQAHTVIAHRPVSS